MIPDNFMNDIYNYNKYKYKSYLSIANPINLLSFAI